MHDLFFDYRLEESVPLDRPAPRHLERWVVSVSAETDAPGSVRAEIGSASVLIIHLDAGADVRDLTDAPSGTWLDKASDVGVEPPSHVLLLDRIWLEPEYRGDELGPIIAAAVIERLGRGCDLAVCYPAPFEAPCDPDQRAVSVAALSRIWAKVGFRRWDDGVWMLDPQHRDSRAALSALIAGRHQRGARGSRLAALSEPSMTDVATSTRRRLRRRA